MPSISSSSKLVALLISVPGPLKYGISRFWERHCARVSRDRPLGRNIVGSQQIGERGSRAYQSPSKSMTLSVVSIRDDTRSELPQLVNLGHGAGGAAEEISLCPPPQIVAGFQGLTLPRGERGEKKRLVFLTAGESLVC